MYFFSSVIRKITPMSTVMEKTRVSQSPPPQAPPQAWRELHCAVWRGRSRGAGCDGCGLGAALAPEPSADTAHCSTGRQPWPPVTQPQVIGADGRWKSAIDLKIHFSLKISRTIFKIKVFLQWQSNKLDSCKTVECHSISDLI